MKLPAKAKSPQYECGFCHRSLTARNKLVAHIAAHHSQRHLCGHEGCGERFDSFQDLRRHQGHCHRVRHRCEICEFSSLRPFHLQRHIARAHVEGVRCSVVGCNTVVPYNRLKTHMVTVHAPPSSSSNENRRKPFDGFPCDACGKHLASREAQRRHVARVHERRYRESRREKKYACTVVGCEKAFTAPTLLQDHMNKHNGETKFDCDRCKKCFFSRARFAVHLKKYHMISIRDVTNAQ